MVVCEGKTDSLYLKLAIRRLAASFLPARQTHASKIFSIQPF
jgi:hypothetical protein